MRTIGLIGGMSWESTAVYYRIANELVRDRLGGLHSAKLLLASLDFQEVSEAQQAGDWPVAASLLAETAKRLEDAGAEVILICTNTMHIVFDEVQAAVSVPMLHIGDVTAEAVRTRGITRVALLGTAFTMEMPFYRNRLAAHNIEVRVPDAADRALIHSAIFDELALGVISAQTRERFQEIIRSLVAAGAEGIILGCTEIELLIGEEDSPVPIFPTARLHTTAAIEWAFATHKG